MANVNAVKKAQENKEKGLTVFQPAQGLVSQLTSLNVTIDTVGVNLPDTLTLKDCSGVMESIANFQETFAGTYRWAVGDIVLYAQNKFGDTKYSQVLAHTKMDAGDARNCVWVSRAIPPAYRVEGLSWTHHRVVATDDIPDVSHKRALLLEARDNNMSVSQFRIYVESKISKKAKPKSAPASEPVASVSSTPPPPSYSVTSFQAVCKWAENAGSQPEIQYLIDTLTKKVTDIQYLAGLTMMADAQIEALGKLIGMEGIPSANAEDIEDDPATNAIAALESIGVQVYTPNGKQTVETDDDGVIVDTTEYVPIDEVETTDESDTGY